MHNIAVKFVQKSLKQDQRDNHTAICQVPLDRIARVYTLSTELYEYNRRVYEFNLETKMLSSKWVGKSAWDQNHVDSFSWNGGCYALWILTCETNCESLVLS